MPDEEQLAQHPGWELMACEKVSSLLRPSRDTLPTTQQPQTTVFQMGGEWTEDPPAQPTQADSTVPIRPVCPWRMQTSRRVLP
jgi:hypothetical protein